MNTSKQVNVMIGLLFLLVISVTLYWLWDPIRADDQTEKQEEASIERGANLFATFCRTCHGNQGLGALERSDLPGLPLNLPDNRPEDPLLLEQLQRRIRDTIVCGRVGTLMPAWSQSQEGPFNEEQISQLVTLITSSHAEFSDEELGQESTRGWEEALEIANHGHGTTPGDFTGKHVASDVTGDATTIPLDDASGLPREGGDYASFVRIENEVVRITRVDGDNLIVQRAQLGTEAVAHAAGTEVYEPPQEPPPGPINESACGQIARAQPSPGTADGTVRVDSDGTVDVGMQDDLFVQNRIEAPTNQAVTVNVTNGGSNIHNMRIAGADTRYDTVDDFVSNPETVRGGQTATLNFNFAQTGTYEFRCDFHPTNMTGSIIVGQ
jgi:plastocyanin/mono/diheme cytochrome c family protein